MDAPLRRHHEQASKSGSGRFDADRTSAAAVGVGKVRPRWIVRGRPCLSLPPRIGSGRPPSNSPGLRKSLFMPARPPGRGVTDIRSLSGLTATPTGHSTPRSDLIEAREGPRFHSRASRGRCEAWGESEPVCTR